MNRFSTALLTAVAALTFTAFAAAQNSGSVTKPGQSVITKDTRFFPLEDLRPGMKGIARTVFSGSEPQEFGVEILGILPGLGGAHQSGRIARLNASNVENRSVFAGMAGWPVYIEGRLVGAIAFSFPFS